MPHERVLCNNELQMFSAHLLERRLLKIRFQFRTAMRVTHKPYDIVGTAFCLELQQSLFDYVGQ